MAYQLLVPIYVPDNSSFKLQLVSRFMREDGRCVRTNTIDRDGTISACVTDGPARDWPNNLVASPSNAIHNVPYAPRYYANVKRLRNAVDASAEIFAISRESIEGRIVEMNHHMASVNYGLKCDYIGNNFYGCTAAGMILKDNILQIFNIWDANFMAVDCNGQILIPPLPDLYNSGFDKRASYVATSSDFEGLQGKEWDENSDYRAMFRKVFVNGNVPGGFGTLNGDPNALNFINIKTIDLSAEEYEKIYMLMLYTDGNIDVLTNEVTRRQIVKERYPHFKGSERTLVSFQKKLEPPNQFLIK
jgi:hypothetical protein